MKLWNHLQLTSYILVEYKWIKTVCFKNTTPTVSILSFFFLIFFHHFSNCQLCFFGFVFFFFYCGLLSICHQFRNPGVKVWVSLLPNQTTAPATGGATHTEHPLSQSSQLHVGTLECILPVLVQWELLATHHNGAAPERHFIYAVFLFSSALTAQSSSCLCGNSFKHAKRERRHDHTAAGPQRWGHNCQNYTKQCVHFCEY